MGRFYSLSQETSFSCTLASAFERRFCSSSLGLFVFKAFEDFADRGSKSFNEVDFHCFLRTFSLLLPTFHSTFFTSSHKMQTIKSRLKESYTPATCPHCQTSIEYLPPQLNPSDDAFQVECAKCNQTWIIRPPKPKAKKGRTIGSGQYTVSRAVS